MSLPYVLPVLVPILVAVIAAVETKASVTDGVLPPLKILQNGSDARNLLGLLWQVEGSILALVTAVVLFAFEGLTRSRPGIPIWEYAGRSGLAQYLMLGGAGLSSIPVVLLWSSRTPPPTATHLVTLVSVAGIAALPFLVFRAMRIVDSAWLRTERLNEVRVAVSGLVREDAIERISLNELHAVATAESIEIRTLFPRDDEFAVERTSSNGYVYDIDLARLRRRASETKELQIRAIIGDRVGNDTQLLSAGHPSRTNARAPVFVITEQGQSDHLENLLAQIKEEALEALRSESSTGITAVSDAYTEMWLAWPRAWSDYGQRLANDFLGQMRLFRLTPMDTLWRDLWSLLDIAVEKNLRDHAMSLIGISYRVGREAVELDAPDILKAAARLARSALDTPDRVSSLAKAVNSTACRFQLELCNFSAIPRLEDGKRSIAERRQASEALQILFRSIIESLRALLESQQIELFEEIDREFCRLLSDRHLGPDEFILQEAVGNSQFRESMNLSEKEVEIALEAHGLRRDLTTLRIALRISLLGWGLHASSHQPLGDKTQELLVAIARSFSDIGVMFAAVGRAFAFERGPLSEWVMSSLPSGDAHIIDDEGPLLRAFSLILFASSLSRPLPAAEWLTQSRVDRVKVLVDGLASDSLLQKFGFDEDRARSSADEIKLAMDEVRARQVALERQSLIVKPLDVNKVSEFRSTVISEWRDGRLVPSLLSLCATTVTPVSLESLGGQYIGFKPKLEPKGLFVTPTNWGGLEIHAKEYGRRLARGEFDTLIAHVGKGSAKLRVTGSLDSRLDQGIQRVRSDGFVPSLILVPSDYQLLSGLNLPPQWQRERRESRESQFLAGYLHDIPVVEWPTVKEDRIYVVDLAHFLDVEEVLDEDGTPVVPICDIDFMDRAAAHDLKRIWNRGRDAPEGQMTVEDIQSSVRIHIRRPFKIKVKDSKAARSFWLPPTVRRQRPAKATRVTD